MKGLGTRIMAPTAKTCLMEEILKGMQKRFHEIIIDGDTDAT